jgi:hypothetical protein
MNKTFFFIPNLPSNQKVQIEQLSFNPFEKIYNFLTSVLLHAYTLHVYCAKKGTPMIAILKKDSLPLKAEYVDMYVPSQPGVFVLAVFLANGTYQPFYMAESDNLHEHLKSPERSST